MQNSHTLLVGIAALALCSAVVACNRPAPGGAAAEQSETTHDSSQTTEADVKDVETQVGSALPEPEGQAAAVSDEAGEKQAVFAGGCFWCTEAVFEQIVGVSDVVSGYTGGTAETADYRTVCTGRTDHAEAVRITYDPSKVSYGQLLKVFFATHDPTQLNRQGPDVGPQYRSAVFFADDQQKQAAEAYIRQLEEAGTFDRPIVTTLEPLEKFYEAEAYHQDYARKNPRQPYLLYNAFPKVEKVREKFGDLVKDEAAE